MVSELSQAHETRSSPIDTQWRIRVTCRWRDTRLRIIAFLEPACPYHCACARFILFGNKDNNTEENTKSRTTARKYSVLLHFLKRERSTETSGKELEVLFGALVLQSCATYGAAD